MRTRWAYGLFTSWVGSAAIVRYCLASQHKGTDIGSTLRQIAVTTSATNRARSSCPAVGRPAAIDGSAWARLSEARIFEPCCVGIVLAPGPCSIHPDQPGVSSLMAPRKYQGGWG